MNQTIITDNGASSGLVRMFPATAGAFYRFGELTIIRGTVSRYPSAFATIGVFAEITGDNPNWRIDHIDFQNQNWFMILVFGRTFGVIDHISAVLPVNIKAIQVVAAHQTYGWGGPGVKGNYGEGSWWEPSSFGTGKAVYIKDQRHGRQWGQQFCGGN